MAKKKLRLTGKRFGVRYGKPIRIKVSAIEENVRKKHKCPYCNYDRVRRLAAGIWYCEKCGSKFTGKAYDPGSRNLTKKQAETEFVEAQPEVAEEGE
jgi:large subunit ribosomal protein L37Ae